MRNTWTCRTTTTLVGPGRDVFGKGTEFCTEASPVLGLHAEPGRYLDQFQLRPHAQLRIGVRQVGLNRPLADVEQVGDLGRGPAARRQGNDFALSAGQPVGAVVIGSNSTLTSSISLTGT